MVELATISPPSASLCSRWATFTASPITVYSSRPPPPIAPAITCPVFTPDPDVQAVYGVGAPSLGVELGLPALHRDRAPQGAFGVVVDRVGRAEHHHHRVALELVDHPQVLDDDLGHRREVPPTISAISLAARRSAIAEKPRMSLKSTVTSSSSRSTSPRASFSATRCGTYEDSVRRRGLLRDDGGVQLLHVVHRARGSRTRAGGHLS
mgnify:CR=1 FL=1